MKKKIFTTAGALAIAGVIGFNVYQSSAVPAEPKFTKAEVSETAELETVVDVTEEKVQNLSNEEARELALNEYPGIVTEFEVESKRGGIVYKIDIKTEDMEYELKIDGETGEILKVEKERDFNSKAAEILGSPDEFISMLEAEEIALNEFEGIVKQVELDRDDGRLVYELELKNDREEAEFEIDARTGELIDLDVEYDD